MHDPAHNIYDVYPDSEHFFLVIAIYVPLLFLLHELCKDEDRFVLYYGGLNALLLEVIKSLRVILLLEFYGFGDNNTR